MGCSSCKVRGEEGEGVVVASLIRVDATTLGDAPVSGMEIKRVLAPIENAADESMEKPPDNIRSPTFYRTKRNVQTSRVRFNNTDELFNRYQVTEQVIGIGVSGGVKIAVDRISNRHYALKILNLENKTPKKAAMLRNEVDIYIQLDHPNIASLVEVYEDERRIYLLMELCSGRELYERIAIKKRYKEPEAAGALRQMLEAINYCHRRRVCHRDLKLENWVYENETADARLKLIDFGFARTFNQVVPMTAMHGTVYYVSPEVMDGCYREKCDLWSVGVIAYMLLSGVPPFNGSMDYQILAKVRAAQYSFDSTIWTTISAQAKDFISKLLQKNCGARMSAEEALEHPWIVSMTSLSPDQLLVLEAELMHNAAVNLKAYAEMPALMRLAVAVIAFKLECSPETYKLFRLLAAPSHGAVVEFATFNDLLEKQLGKVEESLSIFERLNCRGDGELSYTEFLCGILGVEALKSDDRLIVEAFNRLDADEDGCISQSDLKTMIGNSFGPVATTDILNEDERVTFDTFRALIYGEGSNQTK